MCVIVKLQMMIHDDDLQAMLDDSDVGGDVKVIIVHNMRSENVNNIETATLNHAE